MARRQHPMLLKSWLYAMAALIALTLPASAEYKIVHSFAGGAHDGSNPWADVKYSGGSLYGTAAKGGPANAGVVFKIAANGAESVLHAFTGKTDGGFPYGLTRNLSNGDLYGVTGNGGLVSDQCLSGCGVVYKLTSSGAFSVLHAFESSDGDDPQGNLIRDPMGNVFGTAALGGNSASGVIFKLTADGSFSVLYRFTGGSDGKNPFGGLDRDAAGNLYGTAFGGGSHGYGVMFKLAPGGKYSVLHSFAGGSDGAYPVGDLVHDAKGNRYGVTEEGGARDSGTIYKLGADGSYSPLYVFSGGADGKYPQAGLLNIGGFFYGTAWQGGEGFGTVFRLLSNGSFTVLHAFTNKDGANPYVKVTRGGKYLYGATFSGGAASAGVVFRMTKQ